MSHLPRVVAAIAVLSFVCGTAAFADSLNRQPLPPGKHIALAGGKQGLLTSAHVLMLNVNGKWTAAPRGGYTLKNGGVVQVGLGGIVAPTSLVKIDPQPEPPGTTVRKSGY